MKPDTHSYSIFEPFIGEAQVRIGGRKATEWIEDTDRCHFLYSRDRLRQRIELLRKHLPEEMGLHFAVKSNPFGAFLKSLDDLVDGFDIASIGEFRKLRNAGCSLENVSFAGPGKTEAEIREAIENGVKVIVESPHQLDICAAAADELQCQAKVMVRINDHKARSGGGLSMSGSNTVFGWDISDFQENGVHRFSKNHRLEFWGLHLFFGSQILQEDAIVQGISQTKQTLLDLELPGSPRLINIGGGLGVPYAPGDAELDLSMITSAWEGAVEAFSGVYPDSRICTELGRFISAPTGLYLTRVLDKKRIGDTTFLICSGGLNHFSAATGNFGQVFKRNHPIWPVEFEGRELEEVTVVGPLCTPMDTLSRAVSIPRTEVGEYLAVFQAGAYSASASPIHFLSHPVSIERMV